MTCSSWFPVFLISSFLFERLQPGGDDFLSKTFIYWPAFAKYRRPGTMFSSDSCGGQPADVAQLRGATTGGELYLFQSDRWDNADQNEAQALQYWQPLQFGSTGSILPLTCAATSTINKRNDRFIGQASRDDVRWTSYSRSLSLPPVGVETTMPMLPS